MAIRTARTIDGMHMAGGPNRRTIGFDDPKKTQSRQKARPVSRQKLSADPRHQVNLSFAEVDRRAAKERARLTANKEFIKPVSTLEFDLSSKDLRPDYSLKKRDIAEAPSRHNSKGKNKGQKKKHTKLKIVIIVILLLVGLGVGAFAIWGNRIISKLTGGQSGIFEFIGAISSNVPLKADKNGRTNILIFGTSGFTMDGSDGNGSEHDGSQLTDSVMLLSLDQETKDVAMVSLPRDLYVGNTCTATGKVNEVYFCANLSGNDEESGATALENVISEIFDVEIQYHIHLDWTALIQIVDSLGGITVTLDEDIEDPWTGTYIAAGQPTQLDGWHATALARARHGTTMGDFTRGNSQQKIIAGIQQRIVEKGLDLGTGLSLVESIGDNVRMNFSIEELKTIFSLAKEISLENMRQIPLVDYAKNIYYLTTADMNGISYVVPSAGIKNYKDIQKYVHKMISSNPAVREDATILVLNGSDTVGAASTEQAKLEADGFTEISVANAPDGEYPEKYYLYTLSDKTPGTVALLEERYGVTAAGKDALPAAISSAIDTTKTDIILVLGSDSQASN